MTDGISIKEYIENNAFIQSWKQFNRSSIHPIFLEYLYWVIALFVGSFYWYRIAPMFSSLIDTAAVFQNREFSSVTEFLNQSNALTAEWTTFKVYTIAIVFILLLNYTIFKYLVWKKITKKQIPMRETLKQLGLFSILTIGVAGVLVLILVISYYSFVLDVFNILFFFVVPLIGIYTINLLHPLFVATGSIKHALIMYWNIGIKKIHRLIFPYLLMLGVGILVMNVLLPLFLFLPIVLYFVWYVICISIYFLWIKYYLYVLIQKIEQKQGKSLKNKKTGM